MATGERHDREPIDADAPLRDVRGKVAFITGGSSGIGLGIARACFEAGMKVAVTYRTERHMEQAREHFESAGSDFLALEVDVTDRQAVAQAADTAGAAFGNVHLLCLNAGVGVAAPITEATFADWDLAIGVNVGGVVNCLQAFLPRMIAHGEPAHVVATSSMSGLFHGGSAGVYTPTKFAVVGMMEALRAELASRGIGVSVFCPGLVASNIFLVTRNRPSPPSAADVEREARFRALMSAGMDPLECGRKVLQGIRRNDMYILTHPEFEQGIRDRYEVLLASIPRAGEPVPPERLRAERTTLRHAVYVTEKERLARRGSV